MYACQGCVYLCVHKGTCSSAFSNVKKIIWTCCTLKKKSHQAVLNCMLLLWDSGYNKLTLILSKTRESEMWIWAWVGTVLAHWKQLGKLAPSRSVLWKYPHLVDVSRLRTLLRRTNAAPVRSSVLVAHLLPWKKAAKVGTSSYLKNHLRFYMGILNLHTIVNTVFQWETAFLTKWYTEWG